VVVWSGLLEELLMNRGDAEVSFLSNGIFHQRVLVRRDGRRARQASRGGAREDPMTPVREKATYACIRYSQIFSLRRETDALTCGWCHFPDAQPPH
jgi:hypothetical protein